MSTPQPPYPWDSGSEGPRPAQSLPPGYGPPPGYRPGYPPQGGYAPLPPQPPRTPIWVWVLLSIGIFAVVVVVALVWIRPLILDKTSDKSAAGTSSATATSASAVPRTTTPRSPETLPSGASRCSPVFSNSEFPNSAVGSAVTSCEFAEEVRYQFVSQSQRDTAVTISAVSPVTATRYSMSCSGKTVVTCTGGNNAVVYVY